MALADDLSGLEHRFIDANGIRLHVAVGGREEGALVVLLHGFPEIWMSWRHQFQPLLQAGFRVAAVDMRGYNTSDKPKRVRDYRVSVLVEDIAGVVAALGRDKAHVVAHDWGGVVAWHLARRRSDVLDKLVILNSPHPELFLKRMKNPDQALRMYYAGFFQLPIIPERTIAKNDFSVLRNIFKYQPKRANAYDDDDIRAYLEAFKRPGALTGALNYYRAMGRSLLSPRARGGGASKREIDRPTLVMWGLDDKVLPPELLDGLDRKVQKLQVVRIPNCSHWVAHDAPEIVNRELLRFLE